MCAIFGWFGTSNEEQLHQMADSMRHRGPDGEGFIHTPHAAIGMTRLAILDLDNGQQPFHSNNQQISAVCNGEIYNFTAIRKELLSHGHQFQTECDCEILPAAYQQWGIDFLQKLNGMFAIAIYDHSNKQLIIARDRCGQKPLYYAIHNDCLYFSSEIRGLHNIGVPKALNHSAIPSYLNLRYVPEPDTMFEGISILPAGHFLKIDTPIDAPNKAEPCKWFHLPEATQSFSNPIEELHQLTSSSIREALISDVPIALHLSAGIDSSVLLAEIHQSETPVHAITAGFGAHSDEVREAQLLCKNLNIPHTAVQLGAGDLSSLPRVISQMELPVGDALILAFDSLASATADAGCKVAIGGEGVDEIFAGYSFHKFMMLSARLGALGRTIAASGLGLSPQFLLDNLSAFPADLGNSGKTKIKKYIRNFSQLSDYQKGVSLRTLFDHHETKNLCGKHPIDQPLHHNGDLLDSHLRHQFQSWLQDWAIIRQERNTMAHSIEYRMPLLDHRLINFGFSLENKHKINALIDKHIWRQMAAKHYPFTQHKRTKQPFFFPTEQPSYFAAITELLDSTLGTATFQNRGLFDQEYIRNLRTTAEQTREFLPIKQLLSLAILELWMQEHRL